MDRESEFPSNSHGRSSRPEKAEKKVEKVVDAGVSRRKKPLGKRMRETLFGGSDARSVWGYVMLDVLVPAAKDMFADAVTQGVERMIWPDSNPRRRGRGGGGYSPNIHYNYNGRYSGSGRRDEPRDRPQMSKRGRAMHDFDEIILDSRVAAEEVIDRLFDLVSQFQVATVADLYDMVGIQSNYTDAKYGWEDIQGAHVTRVTGGYLLDLPRPGPLD